MCVAECAGGGKPRPYAHGSFGPRLWHSTLAVPVGPAGVELCLAWGERSEPQDRHTAITIPGPRFRGPMSHRVAPLPVPFDPFGADCVWLHKTSGSLRSPEAKHGWTASPPPRPRGQFAWHGYTPRCACGWRCPCRGDPCGRPPIGSMCVVECAGGGKPRPYENAANGCCVGCPGVCRPCRVVWSPLRYMSAPQGSAKGLLAQFL